MADGMIFQVTRVKVKLPPHKIRNYKKRIMNNRSTINRLKNKKMNKIRIRNKLDNLNRLK